MIKMKYLAVVLVVTLMAGLAAQAEVIIFDDAFQSGFNKHWDANIVTSSVVTPYEGTSSVRRASGTTGNGVIVEHSSSFSYGSTPILDFYVNSDSTGTIGFNMLRVQLSDNSLVEMGTRGPGVTWTVDGVPTTGTVSWTNDPNQWTHVTFDLSQTYWYWNGSTDAPASLASTDLIKLFEVRYNSAPSGNYAPYLDDVRLVEIPEPSSLLLITAVAPILLRRRR